MTKKDYEAIAEVINGASVYTKEELKEIWPEFSKGFNSAIESISEGLIKVFEEDNSRFDSERFLKACGL